MSCHHDYAASLVTWYKDRATSPVSNPILLRRLYSVPRVLFNVWWSWRHCWSQKTSGFSAWTKEETVILPIICSRNIVSDVVCQLWHRPTYTPRQAFWTNCPRVVFDQSIDNQWAFAHGWARREIRRDTYIWVRQINYCLGILFDCFNSERREHNAFQKLMRTIPGLEERLMEGSDENVIHIAELVCIRFACSCLCQHHAHG